jgi:hypothetical protein
MSKASPMSEEFHDWLDRCPVQWFRGEVNKDHVAYYFETPEKTKRSKQQATSVKHQATSLPQSGDMVVTKQKGIK